MLKYYYLLTGMIVYSISFAQNINEPDTTETKVNLYEVGYAEGRKQGSKEIPAGFCAGGFLAGSGGGCVSALVVNETFAEDENKLIAASIAGSVITGGVFLYGVGKTKNPPKNMSTGDSLYIAGYTDGYRRATQIKRTVNIIGGCLIGAGLSVGVICLVSVIGAISMK